MRTPVISRTMKYTIATVMVVDKERGEVFNTAITIPSVIKGEKPMFNYCKKALEDGYIKVVDIVDTLVEEEKRFMTVEEWLKYSKVMTDDDELDEQ